MREGVSMGSVIKQADNTLSKQTAFTIAAKLQEKEQPELIHIALIVRTLDCDGAQYTVFGFDSRIDWKPTVFLDSLPKNRICNTCGLVSATIALLPCHHTICNRCYEGSRDGENILCPLDKDVCHSEDIIWSTFKKEKLLGRKIQCWNSSRGCDVLGPVCEVIDHLEECLYNAVTCFRCKQSITYKELLGHLETDDCSIMEANTSSISLAIPDTVGELREQLSSLQSSLLETKELFTGQMQLFRERVAADMLVAESVQTVDNTLKESTQQSQVAAGRTAEELALIRSSTSAIKKTLSEVVVLVNEMNSSLSTSFTQGAREVSACCQNVQAKLDDLSASSTKEFKKSEKKLTALQKSMDRHLSDELDVKEGLKRLNERLSDEVCLNISVLGKVAQVVSELPMYISEPLMWAVEEWSKLKEEAASKGEASALSENPKYFYGYCIHPGIKMKKAGEDLALQLVYCVCQGDYDPLIAWPIQKQLELKFLNSEGKEIQQCISIQTTQPSLEGNKRPKTAKNARISSTKSIKVTDVERNGCVKNDKVSVKFTVSRL
ncbi:hypothetical protein HPB48_022339 [Haemaphysalis longicornis]|uniref:RING-type domain-containing protein n=1 Tax=Haemaphysalis longicornis TaxID=44386 RepID=A0A9J6FVI3_HAELO|nr:hypothetical protein HPB48_022339 [Haemaphysalis longicornis]